ncbi:MAG: hypothetical protein Q8R36_03865 [bacterium]|nr:hypothetical protein [bacterium]
MGEFKKSGGFKKGKQGHGFNRHGSSDRPRFGGKGGFSYSGNRDRGERGGRDGSRPMQMFSAVCSECARACEIPFRPTGERPVFCKDCFDKKRGSPQGGYPQREVPPRNFPQRDQRDQRNFTPASSPRPQDLSAIALAKAGDKRIDELKQQLYAVNKKLDTILKIMEGTATATTKKVTEKVKAKKPSKAKK